MNIKNFQLAKYEFSIVPEDELELPPYKGSTLRGGFGSVFRKISCLDKKLITCKRCLLKDKCPYSYIFETSPRPDSNFLKNLEDIPRPFIIEPPLDDKTLFTNAETIKFTLILIGRAVEFLPYFIVTFKELGKEGIGKGRKKFKLVEIRSIYLKNANQEIIYSSRDQLIKNLDRRFTWADLINSYLADNNVLKTKWISVKFLTPTRLKYKDEFVSLPEFHIVFRALLRRIANLAHFHCGETLNIDFNSLIRRATKIKIEEANVNWVDWERYSFAQGTKMKMGGFVGQVRYKGDLETFLPFLLLGEYVHVGKGATFGLGWYRLTAN
ncbi:MAG: CRISPR system precrRNA processing endoribonuclease RAMP protein Cas6 [Candidatus Aminicenantes bacterium]|nr:CRISPR system precrRNA processing endoribonuclease RAMP protein Cas6 [Candidatus Aminicenantes bacterium]